MKPETRDDGMVWIDCYNCGGDGEIDGECTCWDDCCCCLEPTPPTCGVCRGKGGFYVPPNHPDAVNP